MSSAKTTDRTRTVVWEDPTTSAMAARTMPGRAFIEAIASGELPPPPVAVLLGMGIESIEEGRVVFTLEPAEFHYNPIGTVHGGVIATLLDSAAGCAVHSTLPAGWGYTTLDLTTKYLRPATVDSGQLRAEGSVIHHGRTTALAEARLFDERDRLLAYASSSCLLFELPTTPAA